MNSPSWVRSRHRTKHDCCDWRGSLPWLFFALGLASTTGVMASIVGLTGGEWWGISSQRVVELGLNSAAVNPGIFSSWTYWLVWVVPSIASCVVGMAIVLNSDRRAVPEPVSIHPNELRVQAAVAAVLCLVALSWALHTLNALSAAGINVIFDSWGGDLKSHYLARAESFQSAGFYTHCLVQTGIPTLLIYLFVAGTTVSLPSRHKAIVLLGFATCASLYFVVVLAAHQKLLIVNLMTICGISVICNSRRINRKAIMVYAALIVMFIHTIMARMMPDWSLVKSIDHLIGRTGDAYPFAIMRGIESNGMSWSCLFWTIGVALPGSDPNLNVTIGETMYSGSETYVAIAAPVWAFASDGVVGWALSLVLTGVLLRFFQVPRSLAMGCIHRRVLVIMGTLAAYYLTQVPIVGVLRWSYSVITPCVVVAIVALLSRKQSSAMRCNY